MFVLISCNRKCSNGIQDQNETGVDCGGKCWSCPVESDPGVCDVLPELMGKLYCKYPDTNGFAQQAPVDTTIGPFCFMFTSVSQDQFIEVCNGTYLNTTFNSLNGSDQFYRL